MRTLILPLTAVAATCGGIATRTLHGTGPVARELRAVPPLEDVDLTIEGDLDVEVRLAAAQSVWVEGHLDLLAHVLTESHGGERLRIAVAPGLRLAPPPEVEVECRSLAGVRMAGSGTVRVGGVRADLLVLEQSGSGDVVVHGEVRRLRLRLSGSGDVDLGGLVAGEVELAKAGSGTVRLLAVDHLRADVAGSGDLVLVGEPADRDVDVAGSARIVVVGR